MSNHNEGPWAAFYSADASLPGWLPGHVAALRRAEAAEAAEERHRREEAAERAQNRYDHAVWAAMNDAAFRGLPWSADRPFEHLPSVEDRIDAVFRAQDALALSEERRALIDAGVLTLLPATFAGDDEAAPESLTGAPAPPVARSKVRDRITEWAHRTDIGPECMCEVCPSVRVSRRRGE